MRDNFLLLTCVRAGQCGHSEKKHAQVRPKVVQFTNPQNRERVSVFLKQISCGDLFTVFLTTAGEVHTCGAGLYMGMPEWRDRNSAQAVRVDTLVGE